LQGGIHRRTESAILMGTKNLIASFGASNISMIEIADISEVSRATLYNHYRDKSAVLSALLSAEVARLVELANLAGTSADSALAAMRIHDQDLLLLAMTAAQDPRYLELARCIFAATKSEAGTGLAMRWLLGQVAQPISAIQSRQQAQLLVERTLF
jgi:TetR/AcrR family transcriptional regulator, transcriptional repressor of aconitase